MTSPNRTTRAAAKKPPVRAAALHQAKEIVTGNLAGTPEDMQSAKELLGIHGDPVFWIGEVPTKCQLSGRKIRNRFVDGRVPGMSSWAQISPAYFKSIGGKLGKGAGQLYEQQASGRWLKIEG